MKGYLYLNTKRIVIILIIFLCTFVRFYKFGDIPPGFANDEGAIAYQSYSILKTGMDTWGNIMPTLSFKDFGEYLPPFTVYLEIPFIYMLGFNEFALRAPHALSALLAILPIYILTKALFKKNQIALLASLLFAISPLNIGWSRFVYEGNWGMLFYLYAMMFYALSLKEVKYLILSLLFFGFTLTTYHIYYFITPITVLFLALPRLGQILKADKKIIIILFLLASTIALYYLLIVGSGSGRERFRQVSIFSNGNIVNQVNIRRSVCNLANNGLLCRITINKYVAYTYEYFHNYLFHFAPTHLALNGTFLRGAILPVHGLIYPFELAFLYLGVILLIIRKNRSSYILIGWFLTYPAANSFTGLGEISRITHATPLFAIIAAVGIYYAWRYVSGTKTGKIIFVAFLVFVLFNVLSFFVDYFAVFPQTNSKYGSYAYVQLFKKLAQEKKDYERIFVTRNYTGGSPQFQARVFLPVDPGAFQDSTRHELTIRKPQNYFNYTRLDNLYLPQEMDKINSTSKDIVVVNPDEIKNTDRVLFNIQEPTGEISLYAVVRENQ